MAFLEYFKTYNPDSFLNEGVGDDEMQQINEDDDAIPGSQFLITEKWEDTSGKLQEIVLTDIPRRCI